jgi:hypothetical protein
MDVSFTLRLLYPLLIEKRTMWPAHKPEGLTKTYNMWAVSRSEPLASSWYVLQCTRIEQENVENDPRRNGTAAITKLLTVKRKGLSAERSKEWGKKFLKCRYYTSLRKHRSSLLLRKKSFRQNIFWNFWIRTNYKKKQGYLAPVWLFYTEDEEKLIHSFQTALGMLVILVMMVMLVIRSVTEFILEFIGLQF